MSVQILAHWTVERASSYGPEFPLAASTGSDVLIVIAKQIKPSGAALHFKLQRQAAGKWEIGELTWSATTIPAHKTCGTVMVVS